MFSYFIPSPAHRCNTDGQYFISLFCVSFSFFSPPFFSTFFNSPHCNFGVTLRFYFPFVPFSVAIYAAAVSSGLRGSRTTRRPSPVALVLPRATILGLSLRLSKRLSKQFNTLQTSGDGRIKWIPPAPTLSLLFRAMIETSIKIYEKRARRQCGAPVSFLARQR